MPRTGQLDAGNPGAQVEMMIPVRQSGRAKVLEKARGPATPATAAPTTPRPPRIPRVARLMALAIKLQDMIDRGEVRDYSDIARLGYVSRARVSQIMNLLNLAPDVQESLLFMDQSRECAWPERHIRSVVALPLWADQRAAFSLNAESIPQPKHRLFDASDELQDLTDVQ
jgi:hypothetical protein